MNGPATSSDFWRQFLSRRRFVAWGLGAATALAFGGLGLRRLLQKKNQKIYPGSIRGASFQTGHRLRDIGNTTPAVGREKSLVIVGGGIAGLSAAWWLLKSGFDDFEILELEDECGGNARAGANAVSEYPWGAHYIPLANVESVYVRDLFTEFGIIRGEDARGLPVYDDTFLCHDPEERLLMHGRWQEGLVPQIGLTAEDRRQIDAFFELMNRYRDMKGKDGKPAFAIPADLSSGDERITALDSISMEQLLKNHDWDSRPLHWHVNYCCRDDYGAGADRVSAWAGVHYFAARRGKAANADSQSVVTWPEGNAWIVKKLRKKIGKRITTGALTHHVTQNGAEVHVDYLDTATGKTVRVTSRAAILAVPRFIAARLTGRKTTLPDYAPWMVANITLSKLPAGKGFPLAWDNVSYDSTSLGYVVATHQNLSAVPNKTVITCYHPLDDDAPATARQKALSRNHEEWTGRIVADLKHMHPGIEDSIEHIDVWLWGHAMAIPAPGFIWGKSRAALQEGDGAVFFAHSDMSGLSLFEEAQYRGVEAANKALQLL